MKKRSVVGIIITIIFSIILFPIIWASGLAAGAIQAVSSVVKEERKEEIYEVFTENGGMEWVYGMVEKKISESVNNISLEGLPENANEIFEGIITKSDVEAIVDEFYHTAVKGEIYQVEISFLEERVKENTAAYFDREADHYIESNLATIYQNMDEASKKQIKEEAKKIYMAEVEKELDARGLSSFEKQYALTEAEKQFTEQADTIVEQNLERVYAQLDEETKNALKAGIKEEHTYYLKISWPEEHNDASYAFEIDYFKVIINSTQIN